MKRLISVLLSLVLLISAFSVTGMRAYADSYGDFDYNVLPDGTAEITMFAGEDTSDVNIYIEGREVSSIGDHAFHNFIFGFFYSMVSVNMPPTVKNIGESAFHDCSTIQEMNLSSSLETIGNNAFYNCSGLTELALPKTVKRIGSGAFTGCTGLKNIHVDAENANYASKDGILLNKDKTELIKLPDGKKNTVVVPDGVKKLDTAAIFKSQASVIILPASVTELEAGAITDNTKLTELRYLGTEEDWAKVKVGSGNALDKLTFHTHTWSDWSVTREPGLTEPGEEARTCSVCGARETREIAPYGIVISAEASALGAVYFDTDTATATSKAYEKGTEYLLRAVPKDGAVFVGWYYNKRLMTTDETYSNVAYANITLTPLFVKEKEADTFTAVFYNKFGDVIKKVETSALTQEDIPVPGTLQGYRFTGTWTINGTKGKTNADVLALHGNATVWAEYEKTQVGAYRITADGGEIVLPAGIDSTAVPYNTKATVKFNNAKAILCGDTVVVYGDTYTFYVGADITLTYTEAECEEKPTVTIVGHNPIEGDTTGKRFQVLATQNIPRGWVLKDRGFVYGLAADVNAKVSADGTFDLDTLPADGVRVYRFDNDAQKKNTSDQFSLSVGINQGKTVVFYAFIVVQNGEETRLLFSDGESISR